MGSSGVLNYVDCSVGFMLQAPPTGARILSAGLRCALLNKGAAKRQPRTRSAFMADLGKLAMADDKVGALLLCVTVVPGVCITNGAKDLPLFAFPVENHGNGIPAFPDICMVSFVHMSCVRCSLVHCQGAKDEFW